MGRQYFLFEYLISALGSVSICIISTFGIRSSGLLCSWLPSGVWLAMRIVDHYFHHCSLPFPHSFFPPWGSFIIDQLLKSKNLFSKSCLVCKITCVLTQKGLQRAPKWPTGSGKGSSHRILLAVLHCRWRGIAGREWVPIARLVFQ